MYEALVGFKDCDRYVAHSKIDDALRQFPRDGARTWHSTLIESGEKLFNGVIRTRDEKVQMALTAAKWRVMAIPKIGEQTDDYIEVVPKKTDHFKKFRSSDFATEYVTRRIKDSGAFDDSLHIEHLSQSMVHVRKHNNKYSAPSAWFNITGRVASLEAYEHLLTQGIGGSLAFGVGRLSPKSSAIFEIAKAVALSRV